MSERGTWSPETRIMWLERDQDEADERQERFEAQVLETLKRQDLTLEKIEKKTDANAKTLITLLVAIATAGALLGLNVWLTVGR